MTKRKVLISCASGVESVTKKELRNLGFVAPKAFDGKIAVEADDVDVARLNVFLRTADRVYMVIDSFFADTFDALFDGVYKINWADILPFNAKIIINGKSKKSKLFALSSCQSIIKKAILRKLSDKYRRSVFPETGEIYRIEFFIDNDVVNVCLNTSGDGLHKRGYRNLVGTAPIKETLCSALILLSDFNADSPFCDPFCGSGTFPIEATMIALNIAPGKFRDYDYKKWDFFDEKAHSLAMQEALDKEITRPLKIYGFDIDKNAIALSRRHALNAGVGDYIHFQTQDVRDFSCRYKNGCIVTNPPYGERLLTKKQVEELYSVLGSLWKSLDNWSLSVITACDTFEKAFGKKCDSNRKFYNSNIQCRFYQYNKKV